MGRKGARRVVFSDGNRFEVVPARWDGGSLLVDTDAPLRRVGCEDADILGDGWPRARAVGWSTGRSLEGVV